MTAGIPQSLAVQSESADYYERAQAVAEQLQITRLLAVDAQAPSDCSMLLWISEQGIGLRPPGKKAPNPIYVDFIGGTLGYRSRHSANANEPLVKAIGLKRSSGGTIVDATAGLGRDACVLASLGFQVTLLERSPILALMLADGIERAGQTLEGQDLVSRMNLFQIDAVSYLQAIGESDTEKPDVICLDPMFPASNKSAKVKKDMQMLQNLLGKEVDADALLLAALGKANRRVVVKRPRIAPFLADLKPDHSQQGRASRFDLYYSG